MKIRSVSVDGLFYQYDYCLKLNPELTFIHSPNGYGKSIMMHMIYSIFKGDRESLKEIPFDKMEIEFSDDSILMVENSNGEIITQVQQNRLVVPVTDEDIEAFADVIYIPPERMTVRKKDGHLVNALEYCAQELYETIRRSRDDNILQTVDYSGAEPLPDSELEFWCKDLKAKLDFMKDAGFEPVMPSGIRFPPSRYDLIDNRETYEGLAHSISSYVDRDYQLAESIIVFKDIVNSIFINKMIDVTETGRLVVNMVNGTSLPLSKLSSGETQILLIFYNILFHSHSEGLVIIDEPEISLHVSWQQMLGDYFKDICRVRKVQMLVTTHSPQVIHDKWDLAEELVQKNA